MSRLLSYKKLLILLLVAIALSSYFYSNDLLDELVSQEPPTLYEDSKEVFQSYWAERIEEHGAARAYEMFKEAYPPRSSLAARFHGEAHNFAYALYNREGLDAIAVCDHSYAYGCHHEFLSQGLFEHGLPFIEQLYEICDEKGGQNSPPTTCRHGIGHGLLSYIGYERNDLEVALSHCSRLPDNDPIGGCLGGVFMEYSLRTIRNQYMLADNVDTMRPVGADLGEPCVSLPDHYKEPCYYQQTQWWYNVLEGAQDEDSEQLYTNIGDQCDRIEHDAARRACFESIGKVMLLGTTKEIPRIIRLCEAASSDRESELYCRSVAANLYHVGNGKEPDMTAELCDGFEGERYAYCAAHSVNDCSTITDRHHWHFCTSDTQ